VGAAPVLGPEAPIGWIRTVGDGRPLDGAGLFRPAPGGGGRVTAGGEGGAPVTAYNMRGCEWLPILLIHMALLWWVITGASGPGSGRCVKPMGMSRRGRSGIVWRVSPTFPFLLVARWSVHPGLNESDHILESGFMRKYL
jgi:hypothetical protein